MKHVLIIGHGYVGSELARQLHHEEFRVTAVNRSVDSKTKYRLVEGDVCHQTSVQSIQEHLPSSPDCIVHCASSSRGGADAYRAVFLDGIENLHTIFPETPIFFTSSTSVYGQTDGSTVTETSPTKPDRETSRLLVEAESHVCSAGGTVLRLAGIYGPSRSIYLKRILDGTASIEDGEISRYINQIHRDDAAGAIRFLIQQSNERVSGEIFNVSDDEPLTQRECYEKLAYFFGVPTPPEAPPNRNRKRAWTHKIVSNKKLKTLSWEPTYPSFLGALNHDPHFVESMRS